MLIQENNTVYLGVASPAGSITVLFSGYGTIPIFVSTAIIESVFLLQKINTVFQGTPSAQFDTLLVLGSEFPIPIFTPRPVRIPRILRNIAVGAELFVSMVPGLHPRLDASSQFRVPHKRRLTRTSPQIGDFYGLVVNNENSMLTLRPLRLMNTGKQPPRELVTIPYYALKKVLVFSGQTNESTVKSGRNTVVGSTFSQWRSIAWDNRRNVAVPLAQPQAKPAERLFKEVIIA